LKRCSGVWANHSLSAQLVLDRIQHSVQGIVAEILCVWVAEKRVERLLVPLPLPFVQLLRCCCQAARDSFLRVC
jgi:hypothetical protein